MDPGCLRALRQLTKVGRRLSELPRGTQIVAQWDGRMSQLKKSQLKMSQFKRICPTLACTTPSASCVVGSVSGSGNHMCTARLDAQNEPGITPTRGVDRRPAYGALGWRATLTHERPQIPRQAYTYTGYPSRVESTSPTDTTEQPPNRRVAL